MILFILTVRSEPHSVHNYQTPPFMISTSACILFVSKPCARH